MCVRSSARRRGIVQRVVIGRDDDERDRTPFAEARADLGAIQLRQGELDDGRIGQPQRRPVERGLGCAGGVDREARAAQHDLHRANGPPVRVADEDARALAHRTVTSATSSEPA